VARGLDFERGTTSVAVTAADDPPTRPNARIELGSNLPASSHCCFAPGLRIGDG
jgi:hypothetical protein